MKTPDAALNHFTSRLDMESFNLRMMCCGILVSASHRKMVIGVTISAMKSEAMVLLRKHHKPDVTL
jgi:hypothetical protein